MPRPTRIEYPGALYYISIDSVPGRNVFNDDIDRNRFLHILDYAVRRYNLKLHAFLLLDDGYRLLIETPMGNLTKSLQYINSHYMAYLNTRRGGGGRIYSGRYKSPVIEKQRYLLELCRHIHHMPVARNIVPSPSAYHWSSFSHYIHPQEDSMPSVYTKDALNHFTGSARRKRRKFESFCHSPPETDPAALESSLQKSQVFGSEEFAARMESEAGRAAPQQVLPETIVSETARYFNVQEENITQNKTKPNIPRNVAIYLARNSTSTPLEELGELFGVGPSSICNTAKRVEAHRNTDDTLGKYIREVENLISKKHRGRLL